MAKTPLNDHLIDQIGTLVEQRGADEPLVTELRQRWSGIHFTLCSDDDVGAAKPVREYPGFNLYLVDGHDHCLCFTSSLTRATGLVVAEIEEE